MPTSPPRSPRPPPGRPRCSRSLRALDPALFQDTEQARLFDADNLDRNRKGRSQASESSGEEGCGPEAAPADDDPVPRFCLVARAQEPLRSLLPEPLQPVGPELFRIGRKEHDPATLGHADALFEEPGRIPVESEDSILNADHRLEVVVQEGQVRGVHPHKKEVLDAPAIAPAEGQAGCRRIDPNDEPGFTGDRLDCAPVFAAQVQDEVAGADMIERVRDPGSQIPPNRLKGDCQDLSRFPDTSCPKTLEKISAGIHLESLVHSPSPSAFRRNAQAFHSVAEGCSS